MLKCVKWIKIYFFSLSLFVLIWKFYALNAFFYVGKIISKCSGEILIYTWNARVSKFFIILHILVFFFKYEKFLIKKCKREKDFYVESLCIVLIQARSEACVVHQTFYRGLFMLNFFFFRQAFGNRDIRALLVHTLHRGHSDCMALMSLNAYSPRISYISLLLASKGHFPHLLIRFEVQTKEE